MASIFELKSYQREALQHLAIFIESLHKFHDDIERSFEKAQKRYSYHNVRNVSGKPIPKVCFKLPTGGGKTYLAAHCIEKIQEYFYKKYSGLVIWVTTSDTIYKQTLKQLNDIQHPLHISLKNSAFGKLKIFNKESRITKSDLETHLCILVLTIQSFNIGKETKDKRKIYDDSALYSNYFPEYTEAGDNFTLKKNFSNLDTFSESVITYKQFTNTTIKHSLANLIRIEQPLFILDESHRQKTDKAKENIINFNPSFILELSATPSERSSILYEAKGFDLWKEQMIKMPITVTQTAGTNWQNCLDRSLEKLRQLDKFAEMNQAEDNVYIRPIVLIRVQRTGKETRDSKYIHAEDVKDYLLKTGIALEEIAIKSSEKDDLEKIDLLQPKCRIKYIITKHAIAEGWDCPFAYVLCNLDTTLAETALTQMLGRILRQPYTKQIPDYPELNESFVYMFNSDVKKVTDEIKNSLDEHGYGDIKNSLRTQDENNPEAQKNLNPRKVKIKRKEDFKEEKIYLPKITLKLESGESTEFNWIEHILPEIDWSKIKLNHNLSSYENLDQFDTIKKLDYDIDSETLKLFDIDAIEKNLNKQKTQLEPIHILHKFKDLIPNAWIAYDILKPHLDLISKHRDALGLIEEIKLDLQKQIYDEAEKLFKKWSKENKLDFSLQEEYYEIPRELELDSPKELEEFTLKDGKFAKKNLFNPLYAIWFNELERNCVSKLEYDFSKTAWWHRINERQDYYLQGWEKRRIYPDFLIKKQHEQKNKFDYILIETKGKHLRANDDTEYKHELLEFLSEHYQQKSSLDETIEAYGFSGVIIHEDSQMRQLQEIMGG